MDRRCGYCRQLGHNKAKCPVVEYKIKTIKTYVPLERKRIVDLLCMNGYGVGAIVSAYSYRSGEYVNAMISSHEQVVHPYSMNCFVEYRNIKYQKRVRVTMKNFSGVYQPTVDSTISLNELIFGTVNCFSFQAMNISDPSENVSCNVIFNNLKERFPNASDRRGYTYENHCDVVVPSSDTDVTSDMLIKNIYIHDRLGGGTVNGFPP